MRSQTVPFRLLAVLLLFSALSFRPSASALSRGELRDLFSGLPSLSEDVLFEAEPLTAPPYEAGSLSDAAVETLLARLNAIRALAGLNPVRSDPELCALSQSGAVLMAALGCVTHEPSRPDGMPESFFEAGAEAARRCNLAQFNWFSASVPENALIRFMQDDSGANLTVLGHRRWMLCPHMGKTGFGCAADVLGQSYVSVWVTDDSAPADYSFAAWPCEGAFPAEFMTPDTPWSLSPNPARFDIDLSRPHILLEELTSGAAWDFDGIGVDPAEGAYFVISTGRYGDGPAYVFRPDLTDEPALENGYEQNQSFRVTLSGMVSADGEALPPITYVCDMASLSPIDPASVEISPRSLELRSGETAAVSALVYPRWADDLSYALSVSDSSVASIDENGLLTALSPGSCVLTAETVNGRADEIPVAVRP